MEKSRATRYDATSACGGCPIKARCTENTGGRPITRWADEHLFEAMAERVRANGAIMKQRTALVAHIFGPMKRSMDQGYFLLRTRKKVAAEMSLTVFAYKLKRVIKIVGVAGPIAGMIARLASLGYSVWRSIQQPWWCDQLSRAAGWPALPTRQPTFHTVWCRVGPQRADVQEVILLRQGYVFGGVADGDRLIAVTISSTVIWPKSWSRSSV